MPEERAYSPELILRIFLPFILLGFFHILPAPKALTEPLQVLSTQTNASSEMISKAARQVLEFQPWRGSLWVYLGDVEYQAGRFREAAAAYRTARALNALPLDGELMLAQAYEKDHQPEAALQVYLDLAKRSPGSDAYPNAYRLQRDSADWAGAEATLRTWLAAVPDHAQASFELGKLLAITRPAECEPYLVRAGQLDSRLSNTAVAIQYAAETTDTPSRPGARLLATGRAIAAQGDWPLAAVAFERAVQVDPDYAEAWAFWGEARQHLQQGGKEELDTAQQLAPDSTLVQALTALYWQRNGKPELALVYLHAVMAAEPDEPVWQVELANTLAGMGNPEAGLAYIQKVTELEPRDPNSWKTLAGYCFSNDVKVREVGLPAARQALLLAPKDPAGLDLMGWGMLKLGDLVSAERFLQQALQADPDSPAIHLHLGQYYLYLERYDLAGAELRKTISLAGADSETGRVAQRLIQRNLSGSS